MVGGAVVMVGGCGYGGRRCSQVWSWWAELSSWWAGVVMVGGAVVMVSGCGHGGQRCSQVWSWWAGCVLCGWVWPYFHHN